jgi:O-antigen ligase
MLPITKALARIILTFCLIHQPLFGQPDSWNEDVDQVLTATPVRITLGPLPYGSRHQLTLFRNLTIHGLSENETLTGIDVSHASGVRIVNQRRNNNDILIRLAIDVTGFTRNEAFGGFIKKPIRLTTNSSRQPQLIVSIFGWTTLNETSRNFNDYFFDRNLRWSGWWGTPNMAGCILAPLCIFLIASGAALSTVVSRKYRFLGRCLGWVLFALYGVTVAFLAFTYSRGAWIALVVALTVMSLVFRRVRVFGVIGLTVFAAVIFFVPAGVKRVESYSSIKGDLSIANRIKLWTGAWQMIADHPLTGVGPDQFGPVFAEDYQRFDHTANNSTAVSDYLTFGAEHGLVLLSLITGSLACLLLASYQASIGRNNGFQFALASTLLGVLLSSAFSTFWFVTTYQYIFVLTVTALSGCLLVQTVRTGPWKQRALELLTLEARCVFSALIFTAVVAAVSTAGQSTQSSNLTLATTKQMVTVHFIHTRWKKAKGLIVYFPNDPNSMPLLCHAILRPLAARGWDIMAPYNVTDSNEGSALIMALRQKAPTQRLFVAGGGEGGRVAWLTAAQTTRQNVVAGAGFDFLTMDLDTTRSARAMDEPFLVYHCLYDDRCSANPAICAQEGKAFKSFSLTILLSSCEARYFSQDSTEWIRAVDQYFSGQIAIKQEF